MFANLYGALYRTPPPPPPPPPLKTYKVIKMQHPTITNLTCRLVSCARHFKCCSKSLVVVTHSSSSDSHSSWIGQVCSKTGKNEKLHTDIFKVSIFCGPMIHYSTLFSLILFMRTSLVYRIWTSSRSKSGSKFYQILKGERRVSRVSAHVEFTSLKVKIFRLLSYFIFSPSGKKLWYKNVRKNTCRTVATFWYFLLTLICKKIANVKNYGPIRIYDKLRYNHKHSFRKREGRVRYDLPPTISRGDKTLAS